MRTTGWGLLAVIFAGIAVSVFYLTRETPPVLAPPETPVAVAKEAPAESPIRYPVEQASRDKELPPLASSDSAMRGALVGLWGARALELVHLNEFIRRVVATVDNLPRSTVALRLMPVKPAPGMFRTIGNGESVSIRPDNAVRYASYVHLANAVDTEKLVSIYVRFYPLFQQAYQELGYPQGYFNDRLIEVIDHLLEAPEVSIQPTVVQRKVLYEFADQGLESRSAGQKILMRIGNENAVLIKAKLRQIRSELIRTAVRE